MKQRKVFLLFISSLLHGVITADAQNNSYQQQSFYQYQRNANYYNTQQKYYQDMQRSVERAKTDPYTAPLYDPQSAYYWGSPYNPQGPNYMFKNKNNWSGSGTGSQANKAVYIQNNNPDSKSSLISPKDPSKACIVVMRPKGDWSIVDWNIVLNQKQYDSIEAKSYRILEINPGKYDMTCGAMGIGICIQFKANAGSTQYITAEWERFTVLPVNEGESLYRSVLKNKDAASRLTPSSGSKRSAYSTR